MNAFLAIELILRCVPGGPSVDRHQLLSHPTSKFTVKLSLSEIGGRKNSVKIVCGIVERLDCVPEWVMRHAGHSREPALACPGGCRRQSCIWLVFIAPRLAALGASAACRISKATGPRRTSSTATDRLQRCALKGPAPVRRYRPHLEVRLCRVVERRVMAKERRFWKGWIQPYQRPSCSPAQ